MAHNKESMNLPLSLARSAQGKQTSARVPGSELGSSHLGPGFRTTPTTSTL